MSPGTAQALLNMLDAKKGGAAGYESGILRREISEKRYDQLKAGRIIFADNRRDECIAKYKHALSDFGRPAFAHEIDHACGSGDFHGFARRNPNLFNKYPASRISDKRPTVYYDIKTTDL